MAREEFTIGDLNSGSSTQIRWHGNVLNQAIPGEFLANSSETYYLARFRLRFQAGKGQVTFNVSTSSTDTSGDPSGQEMSDAWEGYVSAITLEAGSLNITLAGPTHSSNQTNDAVEPYIWDVKASQTTEFANFITAWRALSQADKNATVLILDDGATPPDPTLPAIANRTGVQSASFQMTLPEAAEGTPPLSYQLTGDALPEGLARNGFLISGSAEAAGVFNLTWNVTDSESPARTASQGFTITINPPPVRPPGGLITTGELTLTAIFGTFARWQNQNAAPVSLSAFAGGESRDLFQVDLNNGNVSLNLDSSGSGHNLAEPFLTDGNITLIASDGTRFPLGNIASGDTDPYGFNPNRDVFDSFLATIVSLADQTITAEFFDNQGPTTDTDTIYRLSATVPNIPGGGQNDEDHLPAGWTRARPSASLTQNVYRVERIRTYQGGVFQSATAWGNREEIETLTHDTDEIFRLSATAPNIPGGGTSNENHVPAGWSRTRPSATLTQAVYRVTRTRVYLNGVFQSATDWGNRTVDQPILVPGPPEVQDVADANGTWNQPFTLTLPQGSNGTQPLSRVLLGALPRGLNLFIFTILGTPEESGDFDLTWRITDADGRTAETMFTITIASVTRTDEQKVFFLSATAPNIPGGGQNIENHLPAGWLRVEPSPDSENRLNVYSVMRTQTFTNGVFVSATAWDDLETEAIAPFGFVFLEVDDVLPASITRFQTRDHATDWQIRLSFERDGAAVSPPATMKLALKYGEIYAITDIPSDEFRASDQAEWDALVAHALAHAGSSPLKCILSTRTRTLSMRTTLRK